VLPRWRQLGLAPAVLACEPADRPAGHSLHRRGTPWQATDVQVSRATCAGSPQCLRRLHELPVPAGIRPSTMRSQARHLAAGLAGRAIRRPQPARACRRAFARIGAARPGAALCHNDLHHLNVLDDGARLWLVDWEYGGRGNPLFDVAGFLALHDLGPRHRSVPRGLRAVAAGRPSAVLDEARWVFDYVQWLWYRSRFPGPADGEAFWYRGTIGAAAVALQ
jgi:thiamine kinase